MFYFSGHIPQDASIGEVVAGDIAAQPRQVSENMQAVMEAAGSPKSCVVKVTICITDMKQFAVVNEIYGSYFCSPFPARACVRVSELPKRGDVEMDAMAQLNSWTSRP